MPIKKDVFNPDEVVERVDEKKEQALQEAVKIENERLLSKRQRSEPEIDFDQDEIEAALPDEKPQEEELDQIVETQNKRQKLDDDDIDQMENPEANAVAVPPPQQHNQPTPAQHQVFEADSASDSDSQSDGLFG